jgi:hypothetical protein
MVHVCETLASAGFVVAAPEFAECIAGNYRPTDANSRVAVVDATMQLVADKHGSEGGLEWGIFGHRYVGTYLCFFESHVKVLPLLLNSPAFQFSPPCCSLPPSSAGGGTASTHPAAFRLGRCCVAGFRSYQGNNPLMVTLDAEP